MLLHQEDKINLDSPVVNYLPKFKIQDERYKNITVRMLLNHSSGLPGTNYDAAFLYEEDSNKDYYQILLRDLSEEP